MEQLLLLLQEQEPELGGLLGFSAESGQGRSGDFVENMLLNRDFLSLLFLLWDRGRVTMG